MPSAITLDSYSESHQPICATKPYSTIARLQGRGKIERLFGTINTELLPELPGQLVNGNPVSLPQLSMTELDAAVGEWIIGTYNHRLHSETGSSPVSSWCGQGWLPNMPNSLEDLDLLLVLKTLTTDNILIASAIVEPAR